MLKLDFDPDHAPGRAIKAGTCGTPPIAVLLHLSPHFDDLREGHPGSYGKIEQKDMYIFKL